MYAFRRKLKKLITFIALITMLGQSFVPYLYILPQTAHAQEVTPTPTDALPSPTETAIPTPDISIVPVPTGTVTPAGTPTPTNAVIITPEVNSEPASTDTATPTPDESQQFQASNDSQVITTEELLDEEISDDVEEQVEENQENNNSPPEEENTEEEILDVVILNNVSAPSLDLDAFESEGSATLATDKADYAPTDTAIISGSGFNAGATYMLVITSEDEPQTKTEAQVTAHENGTFTYAYQLDGIYRPNYKVEAKDSSGSTVAIITFTDSITYTYVDDSAGVNDEPGQKDLTRLGRDLSSIDPLNITWNWDEISMSGSNTADACALFDTNNNGLANYSLCVTWDGNQIQSASSPILYSCNDTRADRCAGATTITNPISSSCIVGNSIDDPFPAGASYSNDTNATCTIPLSDVGGASVASLLDVCSYPSTQPNSDPSDCIIIQTNKGTLSIIKNVEPNDATTNWNFSVTGHTNLSIAISGDGNSGIQTVDLGTYSIAETAGIDTNLNDYSTSWSCTKNGVAYLSGTGSTASNIVIGKSGSTEDSLVCAFTNTLNNGSIVIHKDVQGPNGEDVTDISNNFTIQLNGANSETITDNGTVTHSDIQSGNYTITESMVASGYTLYGISETKGNAGNTGGLSVDVIAGQTTHAYVTNRQNAGTVTVVKDVVDPNGDAVSDAHSFTTNLNPGGQSDTFAEGDNALFAVNPGTYSVTEEDDLDYDELGCKLPTGADATDFSVGPGEQITITCTNKQKKATINVAKDVVAPDGTTDVSDNHAFTAQLNGGLDQSFSESTTAAYLVNPGNYSITELSDNNYDYVSCTPDANQTAGDGAQVTAGSGDEVTVTCVNKQKNAQVTVVKDVRDSSGDDVIDNTNFVVQRDGSGTDDKTFREDLDAVYTLVPGTYTFAELVTAGYTLNSVNPNDDTDVNNGTTVTIHSGENQTIAFTNYQNTGSISGQKFVDTDGVLGTTDDQSNLVNWVIELYACASNFTGCVLSTTDTTDSGGYSFLDLVPGSYQVSEVLQTGWTALTSLFYNVTVSPGENETDKNFVNFENVSVTACKKVDADGDISTIGDQVNKIGWTVNLLTDGQTTDTKITEENGCYVWTDLGPGHVYGVSEETPVGWTNLTDTTHSFGTATGGSDYIYTFVNFENVSISGHKWNDFDGDGAWDDGEPALDGWTINLSGGAAASAITGNGSWDEGYYEFTNLGPGTYMLEESQQAGWAQTAPSNPNTYTINAQSGVNVADEDFGNQGRGSITVIKNVDTDGDGQVDDANATDWTWNILNGPQNTSTGTSQGVGAGTYTASEDQKDDYHVTAVSCNDDQTEEPLLTSAEVTVAPGQNVICTFTNTRDTGTITVEKIIDPLDDTGLFDLQIDEVTEKTNASSGDSTGAVTVITGIHSVGEVAGTDTSLSDYTTTISCDNEDESFTTDTSLFDIQVNSEDRITCTITNARKGEIIVTKYQDDNGDGIKDEDEPTLEGWDMHLSQGEDFSANQTTNALGIAAFDNLRTGSYELSELEQDGWILTNIVCSNEERPGENNISSAHSVSVSAGETVTCEIGNQSLTPILTIAKTNNKTGIDQAPGDSVLYTLTITVDESNANNVTVTDLLPQGFKYHAGSWTASSNVNPGIVVPEPVYASPGMWSLGSMQSGETITLTYLADINKDQHPGLYKDVAWAQGTSLASENVLALAQPQGFVDTNFVGTDVNVVKDQQNPASIAVNNKTEALGASTQLPATGANDFWAILASVMLILGLALGSASYILHKYD